MENESKTFTCRVGESIAIGENTKVTVIAKKGNQVKLGINSPHEVAREEVHVKPVPA